jgi:hypothetical protein
MKAITVEPMKPDTARLEEVPGPDTREGSVLVEAVAVGVCGTDAKAAPALTRADRSWLWRLVSRRVRLEDFAQALERRPADIKVVVEFAGAEQII